MSKKLIFAVASIFTLHFAANASGTGTLDEVFYALQIDRGGASATMISLVPPEAASKSGLAAEAIVGELQNPGEPISPSNFARNSKFVDFLHAFVEREGRTNPELLNKASKLSSGVLAVHVRRGGVIGSAPEDLVGTFVVTGGKLQGYERNKVLRILTDKGFARLPATLEAKFLRDLRIGVRSGKRDALR